MLAPRRSLRSASILKSTSDISKKPRLALPSVPLAGSASYIAIQASGSCTGNFKSQLKGTLTPDALSVSALTHVMLDVSFHDAKGRSLLDISETRDELFKTVLGAPLVMERLKAGKIHIVLF